MSQYAIKKNNNPNNNNQEKRGAKGKKDDDTKSEDKDDNTVGSVRVHVKVATLDKNTTVTPSNSSSIGAHISDLVKTIVPLPRRVQDILVSNPYNEPIWDQTNSYNALVDTIKIAEDLAGAHVMGPDIIVEEEEDNRIYQWADQCHQWDTASYIPITNNDVGDSHTFNLGNHMFNLTKTMRDKTFKTRVASELSESKNK